LGSVATFSCGEKYTISCYTLLLNRSKPTYSVGTIMTIKKENQKQMTSENQPFYKKLTFNLLSIGILCVALIYGSDLIMPLLFAILLATLILPLTNFLVRKNFPKFLSIILPILLAIIVGGGVIYLLSFQIVHFVDDLPALKERFNEVG
jgi:predicted PurR-regulated permease PerM